MSFEKENPNPEIKRTVLKDWAWGNPNYFFEIPKSKTSIKKYVATNTKDINLMVKFYI